MSPENFVGASMSPPQGNLVEKVSQGNLETLLSTFLAREVASPCSPTATFLLEEVA
jgi:hypothetical protein